MPLSVAFDSFKTHNAKCTECKHHFKASDIEYNCMAFSVPQPCPECGGIRTLPVSQLLSISDYRKIWEEMEKNK